MPSETVSKLGIEDALCHPIGEMKTSIDSLPDELLQGIIQINSDAKVLLMTYLVSKRFASLVCKVHTVHVSPECFQRDAEAFTANPPLVIAQVFEEMIENQIDKLIRPYNNPPTMFNATCLPPLSLYLPVLGFVSKLLEIQHLTIEAPSFVADGNLSLKWAAHLEDGVLHSVSAILKDWNDSVIIPVKGVLRDANLRLDLLVQQSYRHPNLQSFTIIDPQCRSLNTVVNGPDLAIYKKGHYDSSCLRNIKMISTSVPLLPVPPGELTRFAKIVLLKYVYTGIDLVEDNDAQVSERDIEELISCVGWMNPEESISQEAAEEIREHIRGNLDSKFVLPLGGYYIFD